MNFLQPALLIKWSAGRTARLKQQFRQESEQLQQRKVDVGETISSNEAFQIVRRRHNCHLHWGDDLVRPLGSFSVDWTSTYEKCSELWAREEICGSDLSALFAESAEHCFLADAVHYTPPASRKIAGAVATKLAEQSALFSVARDAALNDDRGVRANRTKNDQAFEHMLELCAEHARKDRRGAGWRILDGGPPLCTRGGG